jgi:hypothetical protein
MVILDPFGYYSTEPYTITPTATGTYTYIVLGYENLGYNCVGYQTITIDVTSP